MNNQLHYLWNAGRDPSRGSNIQPQDTSKSVEENKLVLRKASTDVSKRST
jgi:hypothetical protein